MTVSINVVGKLANEEEVRHNGVMNDMRTARYRLRNARAQHRAAVDELRAAEEEYAQAVERLEAFYKDTILSEKK